uniref:Uncharacterized protein n=1 Tax=Escherichia coli TaxID=562 RepID=Q2TTT6_ECOLX|nr:hypothetical protein O2ColV189 [Escherichia coli]
MRGFHRLFSTMCINIDADVTPAIEPTQSCSWHGEKMISPEAASSAASSRSFASPSNTRAPVTAPFIAPTLFPSGLAAGVKDSVTGHTRHRRSIACIIAN